MKRRNAIKHIGAGVSAGLMLPTWLMSCNEEDPAVPFKFPESVIIIGAGAAGLYAADILTAQGVNVKILEAAERVGGRVKSLSSFDKPSLALIFDPEASLSSDFPTELGAEKIIGTDSVWAKLISQQKVPVNILTGNDNKYFFETQLLDTITAQGDADFVAAQDFLANLGNYSGSNISVEEAILTAGISPRMQEILNAWIGNKLGTTNNNLSITHVAEALTLMPSNRTEMLLSRNPKQDVLISRFSAVASKVELNTVVKSINYATEKITIGGERTGGEPFSMEADKVIITVPLSVLKAGDINFNPALPSAKTVALSHMDMDPSLRVFLDFKQNFWGSSTEYIYGGTKAPEYFNSGLNRSLHAKTLSVTVNGVKAEELSVLGKDVVPVLLQELDTVYDGKATLYIRKDFNDNIISVIQDWSKEPFIKGGVSYVKPGGTNEDRIALANSISNRLFFAGEATDVNGQFATVNGALLSAERVAEEVLTSLQA